MKKVVALLMVLGLAVVANAAFIITPDDAANPTKITIGIEEGDEMLGIDASVVVEGNGSVGNAASVASFTGAAAAIAVVGTPENKKIRYTGAAIPTFGGGPVVGPAGILIDMPVTWDGVVTFKLVNDGTGTVLNGEQIEAGAVLATYTVPEPLTLSLLGLGGLVLRRRR